MIIDHRTGRRRLLAAGAVAGLGAAGLARHAVAQAFPVPGKPIRIVVPFPPGGTDAILRLMLDAAGAELGAPIVVDSRPGASTIIGAQEVQRAAPDRRIPALPSLPTISEQGVPGIDIVGWQGLFGPAGMNPAVVERIAAAFVRAARARDVIGRVEDLGNEVSGTTPAEFAAIVHSDHERWGRVIQAIGLKLD